ncbi:MAG: serine/threonine-protein kinase [Anaerolineae bacterium]|nr:MAG: serine/threonine-protein kinase [Anaerolineae bacterium]
MTLGTRQFPDMGGLGEGETLLPGTVLQNRYEIIKVRAIGGMSVIYQARDLRFPNVTKLCAIKEMINTAPDMRLRDLTVRAFEREANVMAMLNHPTLPKIFDYFTEGSRNYLVMDFIPGNDLEVALEEISGFLPEEKVIEWAIDICDMLHYLHNLQPEPIIFRDVKPDNIMLTPQGRVMLIDFGIAKVFQPDQRGTTIGTEGYSPPEQYRGVGSPQGDVYALGATMHHLLTKRDPRLEPPFSFEERPVRSINPDVSEALETIVMKALQYDMDKRFSSALEMKLALMALVEVQEGRVSSVDLGTIALPSSDSVLAVWQFTCEDEIYSSPTVSDGVLYVGAYDHNLWALDAKSGDFHWKYATEGGIVAKPCVHGDKVIVGSEDRVLYAVSTASGIIAWSCPTNGRIRSSARVELDHVFFGSDDGHLYTVSALSGRLVWRFQAMREIRSTPTIADEVVYIGSDDGHLYALDIQQGRRRWQFRIARGVQSTPLVFEGLAYVGGEDNGLYAIDARYGSAAWRYRTNGRVRSSPAVAPELGIVYVGSADGSVYAIDAASGRLVWKFATGDQVISSPAVSEGVVYVGSIDGHLYALDAKSGELRWKFRTEGRVVSSPAVYEGMVYVGSTDRHVYALPI